MSELCPKFCRPMSEFRPNCCPKICSALPKFLVIRAAKQAAAKFFSDMGRAKIRTRTRFGTGQNSDTDKIWDGLRFGQISDKFRTRTRFRTDMASEKIRTGFRTRFRTPFRTPFQTQVRTRFRTNFGQDFKDHAALHDHRRRTGPRRQRSRFTTDKARDRISDRTSDKSSDLSRLRVFNDHALRGDR